jgi:hypothetical protein
LQSQIAAAPNGKFEATTIEFRRMKSDTLSIDPQLDFCRCFGGMDKTGTEIALYPPRYYTFAMFAALHKSFWGSPSIFLVCRNV